MEASVARQIHYLGKTAEGKPQTDVYELTTINSTDTVHNSTDTVPNHTDTLKKIQGINTLVQDLKKGLSDVVLAKYAQIFNIAVTDVNDTSPRTLGDADGSIARVVLMAVVSGMVTFKSAEGINALQYLMDAETSVLNALADPKDGHALLCGFQKSEENRRAIETMYNDINFDRSVVEVIFIGDCVFDRFSCNYYFELLIREGLHHNGAVFILGNHDSCQNDVVHRTIILAMLTKEHSSLKLAVVENRVNIQFGGFGYIDVEKLATKHEADKAGLIQIDITASIERFFYNEIRMAQERSDSSEMNNESRESLKMRLESIGPQATKIIQVFKDHVQKCFKKAYLLNSLNGSKILFLHNGCEFKKSSTTRKMILKTAFCDVDLTSVDADVTKIIQKINEFDGNMESGALTSFRPNTAKSFEKYRDVIKSQYPFLSCLRVVHGHNEYESWSEGRSVLNINSRDSSGIPCIRAEKLTADLFGTSDPKAKTCVVS